MFIITIRDVAELLVWICLILFFIWLAKLTSNEKKEQNKQFEITNDKNESEDKNND